MTEIDGLLFDGKNVNKISVSLIVADNGAAYLSNKPKSTFNYAKIAVSPRIADSTRFLTLPDGRLFETTNNDVIDRLCLLFTTSKHSQIHSGKWMFKTALLLVILTLSWLGINFGVPALTYKIAMQVPEEILVESGQKAMANLDKESFKKSKLKKKRQKKITSIFKKLLPANHEKLAYKIHFRQSDKIGANAFALPSGDIIITDELIKISSNDDEIRSILLHEIAHVELRHGIQGIIKTSTILLLVVAATGDVTSLSTLLLGIPALLLDSSYNRKMEWEADTYSLNKMQELKINPIAFADMLEKIVQSHTDKSVNAKEKKPVKKEGNEEDYEDHSDGYWSSHPPSKERIERMKEASKQITANNGDAN